MTMLAREGTQGLRAAAKIAESICALPAVATQDWCDRAAAALLPIAQPGVCLTLIGQVDDRGVISRQEATGVAGCYVADVTTTLGRTSTAPTVIPIDPNDGNVVRVRTNLAQARELGWAPGSLPASGVRVVSPDRAGGPDMLGGPQSAGGSMLGVLKRWDAFRLSGLLVGAAALGTSGRMLIVEIGSPTLALSEAEASVFEAVLPMLARRATMALGTDPSESAHWLTQREQVILQHLLLGKSVREIAEELGRSPHTVHDHVKSLHRKLNASSRGELVARALGYAEMMTEIKPEGAELQRSAMARQAV